MVTGTSETRQEQSEAARTDRRTSSAESRGHEGRDTSGRSVGTAPRLTGTVKLVRWVARRRGSRLSGRDDASRPIAVRRPPLPARGHQPRGLALLPLPARPADGRGAAGRPRHYGQPRDRAAVGAQVWPRLRERDPPTAAPSRRRVAPGRGPDQDRRQEALALAGRRPGRPRA